MVMGQALALLWMFGFTMLGLKTLREAAVNSETTSFSATLSAKELKYANGRLVLKYAEIN